MGAFAVVIVVIAAVPLRWSGQLATPAGAKTETAVFHCPALLGSGNPRGPESTAYPVVGTPCSGRDAERAMAVVDIALGAAGAVLMVAYDRRKREEPLAGVDS